MKLKDLRSKEFRVIIWGRNEYNGSIQCNARSYKDLNEDPNFFFKDKHIHYILRNPCVSWRALKKMKHHYVFNLEGKCISHQPKKWLNKRGWDLIKGKPYAELVFYDRIQNI